MLAKVLKKTDAADIAPFMFPEIGTGAPASKNVSAFVFPVLEAVQAAVPAAPVSTASSPDDIISEARDEAEKMIARAEENSVLIEQAAREKAINEVQANFDAEVAAKVNEMRADMTRTIDQISALTADITSRAETDMVELALMIAKKIVGREVAVDREVVLSIVKVSLAKLHDRSVAEVHLNPEDLAYVQEHRDKLAFRGALDLVEDPLVTVGGCLIQTETGDIDARIEAQFDEIAHGLLEM